MTRYSLALAVVLTGCGGATPPGDDAALAPDLLAGADGGAPADLAISPDVATAVPDFAAASDLALAPPDLAATPPDLAQPPDLTPLPDLVTGPDLVPACFRQPHQDCRKDTDCCGIGNFKNTACIGIDNQGNGYCCQPLGLVCIQGGPNNSSCCPGLSCKFDKCLP